MANNKACQLDQAAIISKQNIHLFTFSFSKQQAQL
jgi:hypothetical protein